MSPDLLLLAAGLSTRYGAPKQLDPVGPGGAALPAYTALDALRAGFGRIVLVTRPELQRALDDHLHGVLGPDLPLAWVHQRPDDLPGGRRPPGSRTGPWGTAHAVAAAADVLEGPFGVANADDWYGPEALQALAAFLRGTTDREGALVSYPVSATLSPHGGVSRARVRTTHGWVTAIEELRDVQAGAGGSERITALDAAGRAAELAPGDPVSMNLWGLPGGTPTDLRRLVEAFVDEKGDQPDAELPLSDALGALVADGLLELSLLPAGRRWFGLTHPEDRPDVVARLNELHEGGTYPLPLAGALGAVDRGE